jgi:O-antigen/teichoic acid export membrane protein
VQNNRSGKNTLKLSGLRHKLGITNLKLNIVANLVGRGWIAILSLALVPLYVHFMGIESYALVGIYTTLFSIFTLLDVGLSTSLNRELARLSIQENKATEARNLVRTLEIIYWVFTGVIALVLLLLVPVIAKDWIRPETLTADTIRQALYLISLVIAIQFPFILYTGGLYGLQRQVLLNALLISMATLRGVGALLILWFISPTIQAFFAWQLFTSILQTALGALLLWKSLPKSGVTPQFKKTLFLNIWRFAAGMTMTGLLGILLNNLDKIILSNLLTLENFGYYTIAATVSTALYMIVVPIFNVVFPRFSQLVLLEDEEILKKTYHSSCQILSIIVLPIALTIAFFAPEILSVWTGNQKIVENAHWPLSLLIIGMALNSLMNIPYALTLAYGWMKFPIYQNIISVVLLIPLLLWATANYGMIGAATTWIILNSGYILIGVQVMHTRLLKSEKWKWYSQDVGLPLVGTLSLIMLGRWLLPSQAPVLVVIPYIGLVLSISGVSAFLITPNSRNWLKAKLRTLKLKNESNDYE